MRVCNLRVCDTVFVCVCVWIFLIFFLSQALGFWVVFSSPQLSARERERERERERKIIYLINDIEWHSRVFKSFGSFVRLRFFKSPEQQQLLTVVHQTTIVLNLSELCLCWEPKKKLDWEIISQVVCTSLCVVCVVCLFQIRKLRSLVFISPKSGFVEVRKTSCLQSLQDQALSFLSLLFNIVVYFSLIFNLLDCSLFVVFQKLQETSQFFSLSHLRSNY
jgi:hypothetical protein